MKNFKIKALLGLVLCLATICFAALPKSTKSPAEIANYASGRVVTIVVHTKDNRDWTGTGFFISSSLIATNFHVVDGMSSGHISFDDISRPNYRRYPIVKVKETDPYYDLAIVEVDHQISSPLALAPESSSRVGDEIYVFGSPRGLSNSFLTGVISSFREFQNQPRLIQISAPTTHGSSGSPVFNKYGNVIGIVQSGFDGVSGLNFASPASRLKMLLEEEIPPWEREKPTKEIRVEDELTFHDNADLEFTWNGTPHEVPDNVGIDWVKADASSLDRKRPLDLCSSEVSCGRFMLGMGTQINRDTKERLLRHWCHNGSGIACLAHKLDGDQYSNQDSYKFLRGICGSLRDRESKMRCEELIETVEILKTSDPEELLSFCQRGNFAACISASEKKHLALSAELLDRARIVCFQEETPDKLRNTLKDALLLRKKIGCAVVNTAAHFSREDRALSLKYLQQMETEQIKHHCEISGGCLRKEKLGQNIRVSEALCREGFWNYCLVAQQKNTELGDRARSKQFLNLGQSILVNGCKHLSTESCRNLMTRERLTKRRGVEWSTVHNFRLHLRHECRANKDAACSEIEYGNKYLGASVFD